MSIIQEQKQHWENELKKCSENPYYFFTTYVNVEGKKATTFLTEQEFNSMIKDWVRKSTSLYVKKKIR